MNRQTAWAFLVLIGANSAFAGGTVFDEEVLSILDQQPELSRFVKVQFDFCKAAWISDLRIGNSYPLGGKRIGPYERRVRPKGSKANFDFILTVNTISKGYDKAGKEVDLIEANKIDEHLTSIDLRYRICEEDWCKAPQPGGAAEGTAGENRPLPPR